MRKKFMIKMASIGAVVLLAAGMAACGKKTEAVITTDGEEFSEPEKEYPTVAQSRAKKFSYNDLTVGKLEYLMTEDEVIKILGEPVTSYNANEKSTAAQTEVVKEKIYSYNELTLIFSEIKGKYVLTAAASVGDTAAVGAAVSAAVVAAASEAEDNKKITALSSCDFLLPGAVRLVSAFCAPTHIPAGKPGPPWTWG